MGPGPHTDKQKEEIRTLNLLLSKAKQENEKTPLPPGTAALYETPRQPGEKAAACLWISKNKTSAKQQLVGGTAGLCVLWT